MTREELIILAFDVINGGMENTEYPNDEGTTIKITDKTASEFGEFVKGVIAFYRAIRVHEKIVNAEERTK